MSTGNLPDGVVHKELDLIQDVIKRMAANSLQVKTWMMGIVTAVLAFKNEEIFSAGKTANHVGIWISVVLLVPIVCFWLLDGFFLRTERLYREVYKWVVNNRSFTNDHLYDLNTWKREDFTVAGQLETDLKDKAGSIWESMWNATLPLFYLIPLAVVLALIWYNSFY